MILKDVKRFLKIIIMDETICEECGKPIPRSIGRWYGKHKYHPLCAEEVDKRRRQAWLKAHKQEIYARNNARRRKAKGNG
jgi:hypothetical protein